MPIHNRIAHQTCPTQPLNCTDLVLLNRLPTRRQQKAAKRYEDMASGRYKPLVEDPGRLDEEVAKAGERLSMVLELIEQVRAVAPELGGELDKVLCHVADV